MSDRREGEVDGRTPRFAAGIAVRVKSGTADPDYPDIPVGGWAGIVCETQLEDVSDPIYLVRWSDETLAQMHPIYHHRCDRDGLEVEQTWLAESDLVPDLGEPLVMEQPAELIPLPLDLDEPLDRARYLIGLTSDDDLPPVEVASLKKFHAALMSRLVFPFTAADANLDPILIRRIVPPEEAVGDDGLLVEVTRDEGETKTIPLADLNVPPTTVSWRDIVAYATWFEEQRAGEERRVGVSTPISRLSIATVMAASLVGAALATLEEALFAAQVGAAVLCLVGAFLGSGAESLFRRAMRLPPGVLSGFTVGLVVGGFLGGALGVLAVCYVGAIPGAIVGSLSNRLVGTRGRGGRAPLICAWAGGLAYAGWVDPLPAAWGALSGLLGGVVLCAVVYFGFAGYLATALRGLGRNE